MGWGAWLAAAAVLIGALAGCNGAPGAGAGQGTPPVVASRPPSPAAIGTPSAAAPAATASGSTAPAPSRALPASPRPIAGWLAGKDWTYIPTSRRVVALTFDAGANADGVTPILATLHRDHVPATFFLTGNFVRDFPATARSIAAAGYRIGDHTINHPYLTHLTNTEVRLEILDAAQQITAATGANPAPLFRFPYGDADARTIGVANRVGYVPVRWTVDTLGWQGKAGHISAAVVTARVLAALRPGEIVLMHVGSNPTDHTTFDASALPTVISKLRARGYSFVNLDALTG
jgi:peptidoglycan/xylan/chitin deacetylase (PgdA/CDA1 family)